jgi:hypothetical protein
MVNAVLLTVGLFLFKHFVVDFLLQNRFPYLWMNKHNLKHPGGYLHAGSHVLATFAMFPSIPFLALVLEFVSHYGMDWFKMNVCKWNNWGATTSPYFWDMLGLDQFVHCIVYLIMVGMLLTGG